VSSGGRYLAAAAIGLLGLAPYVALSTAATPLQTSIGGALGGSALGFAVSGGLASGGYALGAVAGAQLALRHRQRGLFLLAQAIFVLASVGAALAQDMLAFDAARLVQGLSAGAMLIAALPPLITRFGAGKVPLSAGIVDVGIFGTSTLGPLVASWALHGADGWRWMMAVVAVLGALGWLVALVGYERWDPPEPDSRIDTPALTLVALISAAAFAASSLVAAHPFLSWQVLGLLVAAMVVFVALVGVERRSSDPLIPVSTLTTQLPVCGIFAAMLGGAVFVTLVEVMETVHRAQPHQVWPMPVGAAVGAFALWRLFATRLMPVLVNIGVLALGGAALLLLAHGTATLLLASLLLGFGAAATVSPGLFLTGLGLPSTSLGRAFAMVQLLRAVSTYAVAPVMVQSVALGSAAGSRHVFVAMAVVSGVALVVLIGLPLLWGARPESPDLEAWLDGDQAMVSPPLVGSDGLVPERGHQ
jgi:MFS family permease